ncbi:outer membrane protein [Pseudomonas aeruginosa]|nr:outer membrane protein [Pseudomonas aeruginosa]
MPFPLLHPWPQRLALASAILLAAGCVTSEGLEPNARLQPAGALPGGQEPGRRSPFTSGLAAPGLVDQARRPAARPTDRRSPARHPRPADRRGACAPGGGNGPGARCRAPADAGRQGQLLRHPRADQRGPGTARRPLFGDQVPVARLQLRLRPLGRRARRLGSRPRPGQCRPDRQPGRAHRPLGEHRPRLQRPRPRLYRARSRRGRTEALAAHDRAEPEAHERRTRQQGPAATDADPAGHRPPAAQRRRAGHRQRPHRPRRAAGQGARSRSRNCSARNR